MNKQKTVFVGLSGGVDSSVAAYRLKKAGYNVVGVFIKVWHPEFMVCSWEAERLDAMRVAAHLDIPFLTCDAKEAYKKNVADYFIAEYKAGRTPNPDILCNTAVKFGVFLDFAMAKGADYIATGHYVQAKDESLYRGLDENKDQSYFLYALTKEQLSKAVFPVGNSTKDEIRREAAEAGIPTAQKSDSQGICFLGHVDIPEFLSHYTTLKEGAVLNETGETIGVHKGALVYTLGQRQGFSITDSNTARSHHYVVDKNISDNTITVASHPPVLEENETIVLKDFIFRREINSSEQYEVQTRYRQKPILVKSIKVSATNVQIELLDSTEQPAPGQALVIYHQNECIGGGIID